MAGAPGKKAAVLGLGISGYESALALQARGFRVFASDGGKSDLTQVRVRELTDRGIEAESGRHSRDRIAECDWALISPGIPPSAPVYQELQRKNIPIFSEIEVAGWFCPTRRIVAVTGSAGKTTVTTLLARALARTGRKVISCGNIGNPWISEIASLGPEDIVVLELSSFQLMHCPSFRPETGVLLNLAPNHQDWHRDMAEYVRAKLNLFMNQQPQDHAFVRRADEEKYFPDFSFRAQKSYFAESPEVNPNEDILCRVAALYGVKAAEARQVFAEFEGIEHRLEKFAAAGGVTYVNDSKCTTTASLCWALEKFPDQRVILLAGGHPKSDDFAMIRELVRRKVKRAVLIGEAVPLLRRAWQDACPLEAAPDFKTAVERAREFAAAGDTVLLSPACASFDMFRNYEERGRLFKQLIREALPSAVPMR